MKDLNQLSKMADTLHEKLKKLGMIKGHSQNLIKL